MSKATKQALALLGVVYVSIEHIQSRFILGDPSFIANAAQARARVVHAVQRYPASGNEQKNNKWSHDRIAAWDDYIGRIKPGWDIVMLVSICLRCLSDLLDKVRDPAKIELIKPILEPLLNMSDFVDEKGRLYENYEQADKLLDELYVLLGFTV